jgi:hypothetical protein
MKILNCQRTLITISLLLYYERLPENFDFSPKERKEIVEKRKRKNSGLWTTPIWKTATAGFVNL